MVTTISTPRRRPARASAIVQDASRTTLPALVVNDGRRAAAVAAAAAYGCPARELQLVGVTGTNGKTTTVNMLRHLLDERTSARSASIGTLGVLDRQRRVMPLDGGGGLTTPGPIELQRMLSRAARAGVRRVAMEVSSHSLDQRRVEGVFFDVGDVHESHARPSRLSRHDGAVLRRESEAARPSCAARNRGRTTSTIRRGTRCKTDRRRVGFSERVVDAEVHAERRALRSARQRVDARCSTASGAQVRLPLIGDFNVINALGAAAAAYALGDARRSDRRATVDDAAGAGAARGAA